jgi:hypothetical protein
MIYLSIYLKLKKFYYGSLNNCLYECLCLFKGVIVISHNEILCKTPRILCFANNCILLQRNREYIVYETFKGIVSRD